MTATTGSARLPRPGDRAARTTARQGAARAAALPPEQRRAEIIAAAAPLLRSRGHDVTTKQIAQAAGIAEGTVFRAFPTKQAVVDAVVADACDQSATTARIRAIDPTAPLDERVRACARILGDRLATMIDLMIALRMHRPPQPPAASQDGTGHGHADAHADGRTDGSAAHHRHHHERQGELLAAITDLLRPDANMLAVPPERAAHLLRLLTFAGTHRLINDGDPLTAGEVADVLLHGIVRGGPAEQHVGPIRGHGRRRVGPSG